MKNSESVAIEEITPVLAARYLSSSFKNRPLSERMIQVYAEDMSSSNWRFNGESIIFDREGNLLNGQHRMSAIIRSRSTQRFIVVRGVDPAAFSTMDQGKKRTMADILSTMGEKNNAQLAALIKSTRTFLLGHTRSFSDTLSSADLLDIFSKHPGLRDWSIRAQELGRRMMQGKTLACALYCISVDSKKTADEIFHKLLEGTGMEHGDPILALRNYLIDMRGSSVRASDVHVLMVISQCLFNHMNNKLQHKVSSPRGSTIPAFASIIGSGL